MEILFKKILARILFWVYDFLDTIGVIFDILTGTQKADGQQTLLEVFINSAISTQVLIELCIVSVVIIAASVGVKTVKTIVRFKAGGEAPSHSETLKQGALAIGTSFVCIFFVLMFITFSSMLLNMVNDIIEPNGSLTLSQNLFNLSVEQCYVIDESQWVERPVGDFLDDNGQRVQEKDNTSADGLAWEKDDNGDYILDYAGNKIPVWVQITERVHPYLYDANGEIVVASGWVDNYTAESISWSMSPDQVFGVHKKDFVGIFEDAEKSYTRQPMVRLDSFNFFTATLVAVVILISMFMLAVGLVKRIYDIIVLFICMPLVCGTIPLDDGARFRAWRETFMSKVLVAFGAVIALNIFFMISGFILSPAFDLSYLISAGILNAKGVSIFKMLMLLGGSLCINGSQTLIARILGTSADESREAMQSLALITSGVRLGAAGALGAGRIVAGAGRVAFGGRNRYGRETVGLLPQAFRGVNRIGESVGGQGYANSGGAAFVRRLGRLGNRSSGYGVDRTPAGQQRGAGLSQPNVVGGIQSAAFDSIGNSAFKQPASMGNIINNHAAPEKKPENKVRPTNSGLRTNSKDNKSGAFSSDSRKGKG